MATVLARATSSTANRIRFRFSFNFAMALLMAAIITYGFSQTIGDNLIHPTIPRPIVLYVHAAVFIAFMAIYILQTGLVASRNVALHRRLGPIWVVIGAAMPVIGVATGIAMCRFRFIHDHQRVTFMSIILWDMVAFSTLFLLAVLLRKRPEYHRRFVFLATCGLMAAGFSRFPFLEMPDSSMDFWLDFRMLYVGVIVLMLIAIVRDLIVQRRVHTAYSVAVPLIVTGQLLAVALYDRPPTFWTTVCRNLVGVG